MTAFICTTYSGREVRIANSEMTERAKRFGKIVYADRDHSLWFYDGATYLMKRGPAR